MKRNTKKQNAKRIAQATSRRIYKGTARDSKTSLRKKLANFGGKTAYKTVLNNGTKKKTSNTKWKKKNSWGKKTSWKKKW